MKSLLASLAAALLLTACAQAPAPTTPDTSQPVATATAAPPDAPGNAPTIRGASFQGALAAAHLTSVELKPVSREMNHDISGSRTQVEGNKVSFMISGGWNAESLEFARDPSGRIVRLLRNPEVTVKETVIRGCQESAFAGGRGWFERVVIELPPGTIWGGEYYVRYPEVKEVLRYTGKKPDGSACPPPHMMLD